MGEVARALARRSSELRPLRAANEGCFGVPRRRAVEGCRDTYTRLSRFHGITMRFRNDYSFSCDFLGDEQRFESISFSSLAYPRPEMSCANCVQSIL